MKKKYIASGGLAFTEHGDMKNLERFAKEGWILERFTPFGYKLRQDTPQDIEYALDYQKDADADYFSYFEAGSWTHVCSAANTMHIFSAPVGTKPIYTDNSSLLTKYETEKKKTGTTALFALIATTLLFLLPGTIGLILGYISLIVLIFTGMPYIGYTWKVRNLKKSQCS